VKGFKNISLEIGFGMVSIFYLELKLSRNSFYRGRDSYSISSTGIKTDKVAKYREYLYY